MSNGLMRGKEALTGHASRWEPLSAIYPWGILRLPCQEDTATRMPGALPSTTGCLFNKWLVVSAMRGTVMGVHFQSQGHMDRIICTPHDVGELQSLVELLRWRAQEQPQQRAYTFLVDGEAEAGHLTY